MSSPLAIWSTPWYPPTAKKADFSKAKFAPLLIECLPAPTAAAVMPCRARKSKT